MPVSLSDNWTDGASPESAVYDEVDGQRGNLFQSWVGSGLRVLTFARTLRFLAGDTDVGRDTLSAALVRVLCGEGSRDEMMWLSVCCTPENSQFFESSVI
jgi:hypothetical protein